MTPGSFDAETAREVIGDEFARHIEAKARTDAERGEYAPPESDGGTYWDSVNSAMMEVIYAAQYGKRRARLERTK